MDLHLACEGCPKLGTLLDLEVTSLLSSCLPLAKDMQEKLGKLVSKLSKPYGRVQNFKLLLQRLESINISAAKSSRAGPGVYKVFWYYEFIVIKFLYFSLNLTKKNTFH